MKLWEHFCLIAVARTTRARPQENSIPHRDLPEVNSSWAAIWAVGSLVWLSGWGIRRPVCPGAFREAFKSSSLDISSGRPSQYPLLSVSVASKVPKTKGSTESQPPSKFLCLVCTIAMLGMAGALVWKVCTQRQCERLSANVESTLEQPIWAHAPSLKASTDWSY